MTQIPAPQIPTPAFATPAWVMAGWGRNIPGALVAGRGRLAFLTDEGLLFDVPLAAVTDVTWPWHWFGGGATLRAAGTPYKIAFLLPDGAEPPSPSLLDAGLAFASLAAGVEPSHSIAGALDIRRGRAAARQWKEVLPAS